ncbi:hypothetical protein [Denitromonas ohlonensis]|uniref:Uncharacterized protein n=2 Tax=Denitromonas TaxID=139331 RepID=A0A557SIK7_9RHOO|nr:hypothetical protein [Denitromonas ohlonensis]TVO69144.1 hypothetical protein FHP90_00680 [Denitromonas ohlonensis]TVO77244.1 hypothetical protein FHP89_07910 [Denitromonas ohlonensis]
MAHRKEELGKGGEAPYNHSYRQIGNMVRLPHKKKAPQVVAPFDNRQCSPRSGEQIRRQG